MKLNIPTPGNILTLTEDCPVNIYPITENCKILVHLGLTQYFTVGMGKYPDEKERMKRELDTQKKGPEPGFHNPYFWKGIPLNSYYQQHYWHTLGKIALPEALVLQKGTILEVKKVRLDKKMSFLEDYAVEFKILLMADDETVNKLVLRIDDVNKLVGELSYGSQDS